MNPIDRYNFEYDEYERAATQYEIQCEIDDWYAAGDIESEEELDELEEEQCLY